jgi:hypothetical protein
MRICASRLRFYNKFGHPALAPCSACPTVSLHMKNMWQSYIYRGAREQKYGEINLKIKK